MKSLPTTTVLQYAILKIIQDGATYAESIQETLREAGYTSTAVAFYVAVNRLWEQGLLDKEEEATDRTRSLFTLTAEGRAAIREFKEFAK